MIGSFGAISFISSDKKLLTFRDMNKQYAGRYARHEVIGRKPKHEFIGPDARKISFSIRLDATKGVSPRAEINRLAEIVETGEAEPLILGGDYAGLFVLLDVNEKDMIYDHRGRLWLADVQLNLEEFDDE